jgi:predicted ester cyclase
MKRFFLLAFTAMTIASACNQSVQDDGAPDAKKDTTAAGMSQEDKEERNKKIALSSIDGISSGKADVVLKDVTSDAVDYGEGSMPAVKGIDSIKAGLQGFLNAFPDYKGQNIQAVADGDYVYVSGDWSGTFKNDMMGIKATGKSFKVKDVDIFKFNDEGKMTEHRAIVPFSVIMQQVGAKMPPK